jgi:hypothetical protein
MFMYVVHQWSVINLNLTWKQSFRISIMTLDTAVPSIIKTFILTLKIVALSITNIRNNNTHHNNKKFRFKRRSAKCCSAKCHHADCRGIFLLSITNFVDFVNLFCQGQTNSTLPATSVHRFILYEIFYHFNKMMYVGG